MKVSSGAQTITYKKAWLLGGIRTPFADYNATLRDVSATDLGIKAAREALKATSVSADAIDAVVASSDLPSQVVGRMTPLYSACGGVILDPRQCSGACSAARTTTGRPRNAGPG